MYLLYVGMTHAKAPIEVREKLHVSAERLSEALQTLKQQKSILENIIVSTCNRTELYLVVDQIHTGKYYAKHFLMDFFNVNATVLDRYLVMKEEQDVLDQLLRVAVGLESKVIGETQILGQLKQAFERAQQEKTTGIILNQVFRQAITFSKSTHDKYRINDRPASISLVAVQLLDTLNQDYSTQTVALIGMGQIGTLLANYLTSRPFKAIKIVNRTVEKALPYCNQAHITAHPFDELETVVNQADVIFSAISADHFIVTPKMVQPNTLIFDLGVPRTVHAMEHAHIYDVDHLSNKLDHYNEERQHVAQLIVKDLAVEIKKFEEWEKQLGVMPLIRGVREKALLAQEQAFDSLLRKIPHLTPKEQKHVQKHMKSIVNQILKEPILQLKEMSIGETSAYDMALIAKVFGLSHLDKEVEDHAKN